MEKDKKILVAVNGSRQVVDYGLKLAQDEKATITVVKVVPLYEGDLNLTGVRNIDDVLHGGAPRVLAEIEAEAKTVDVAVTTRVEEGDVAEQILRVAGEEKPDLIIMGEPSKGWMSKIFGDGAVKEVMKNATYPILLVDTN